MKHSIFFLFSILALLTLQGCGGGGGDEASTVLSTSTSSTTSSTTTETVPVVINISQDLVTADPIDNRIIQPVVMSTPPQAKVITTEVAKLYPAAAQDMWSENVTLDSNPNEYYVSVDGSSRNTGSIDSPWDLLSVANGDHIIPGNSIVWLKPGEYKHPDTTQDVFKSFNFRLSGEVNAPIHIRPMPQELGSTARATIDGGIKVYGSWLWIWELEQASLEDWRPRNYFFQTDSYEVIEYQTDYMFTNGLYDINDNIANGIGDAKGKLSNRRDAMHVLEGTNSKFLNMTIHGIYSGIGFWANPKYSEFYGNLVYDNGWIGTDRSHGPGLYIQNGSETERIASENIVAGNLSNPMQMRSSDVNKLSALTMIGNMFFAPREDAPGRNYLHVGEIESKDVLFKNNIVHALNVIFPYGGTPIDWISPDDQKCDDNFLYRTYILSGQTCVQSTTNEEVQYPIEEATTKAFIRPNKYDPRRANLAIINGEHKPDISISLGSFAKEGDIIVIHNAVDPYAVPIAYGKYNGEYLNIHWPKSPWTLKGEKIFQDIPTINEEFWAFVITKLRQ